MEYLNVVKDLFQGDNWKMKLEVDTSISDFDDWSKILYIQDKIDSTTEDASILLDGSSYEYSGELTKTQSAALSRKSYFLKIVAIKNSDEYRTLTDRHSRLIIC